MASAEIYASYGGKRFTNESHGYVPSGESFILGEGNKLSSNKCTLSDLFNDQEQLSLSDFSSTGLGSKPSKDATLDFLLGNFCSTEEKSNEGGASTVENADLATGTFSLNNLYCKEELKTCSETAGEQSNPSDFSFLKCIDGLSDVHIDASENNSSNNLTNFFSHCDTPSTEADSLNSSVQEDVIPAVESDSCQSDDLGFSLAGLYVLKKKRTESLSEESTLSNLSEGGKLSLSDELQLEALYSDSSSESGYTSEREKQTVDGIDLGLAKGHNKNIRLDLCKDSVPVSLSRRAVSVSKKGTCGKSRPSLFCRVLGHKAQINNTPSIISPPSDLIDYLESRNYWKYFSFDSPSPDDIVHEKQRKVFYD